VAVLALDVAVSTRKHATTLEIGLYNFIALAVGIGVSYWVGQRSAEKAAADVAKPHGLKAVRRLRNTAAALQDLSTAIDDYGGRVHDLAMRKKLEPEYIELAFDSLTRQSVGPLRTVVDALDDWRDVVPEVFVDESGLAPADEEGSGVPPPGSRQSPLLGDWEESGWTIVDEEGKDK
jgi:hypothetical protein